MASTRRFNTLASFLRSIGYETVEAQFVIHNMQAVSPPTPYQSPIFRANYFTFVLLRGGISSYTLDDQSYPVKPHTLYFTNPGHLKSFHLKRDVDGLLISFSEEYLKQYIDADIFSIFPYLLSEVVPPQYLKPPFFQELWGLCQTMRSELERHGRFTDMLVASYFKIFLLKINESLYPNYNPKEEGDRNSEIVRSFKIQLEHHIQELIQGKIDQLHWVV